MTVVPLQWDWPYGSYQFLIIKTTLFEWIANNTGPLFLYLIYFLTKKGTGEFQNHNLLFLYFLSSPPFSSWLYPPGTGQSALENFSRFVLPSLSSCQCFSLERITNMACLGGKTSSNTKVEEFGPLLKFNFAYWEGFSGPLV